MGYVLKLISTVFFQIMARSKSKQAPSMLSENLDHQNYSCYRADSSTFKMKSMASIHYPPPTSLPQASPLPPQNPHTILI